MEMWWIPILVFVIFIVIVILLASIRVLYEYERGVIFTLGRFTGVRGPGLIFVVPIFQKARIVDLRITTVDIPKQEVMTRDNVPVLVNAVVYYKVVKPDDAVIKIDNYGYAVRQYTQAALRDVIGNSDLDMVLMEREKIAENIKKIVDTETAEWGVDILSIKIQEIELPAEMKRAMAKQAESERERRAIIITSEGELAASENLRKAAENLAKSKGAFLLRTLQTVTDIAADPSDKIVILLPVEMLGELGKLTKT
ncbi:MAG TPA: slipin family protein [Candidatus Bathyarchaeota archaeon]|nr:MAG: slipin family protein [Candidatus Bathyarchaeota archaeon]RLI27270.1 MAG: slipin family protein [Candidatus Bathyarchaeota archaeon]HDI07713.1 slipin family protein [Candidatus Bathyarchaeota archaeon]